MVNELKSDILHEVIQRRPDQSYKSTFGRVLVIAGNQQYGGAGLMAAAAALNAGAGLITLATDPINSAALHMRTPEVMFIDWFNADALTTAIQSSDVILIGPGLGLDSFAVSLVQQTLRLVKTSQKLVLDGSALTIIAQNHLTLPRHVFSVATPHQMEWERLSGIKIMYQEEIQMNQVQRQMLNLDVLVLKQHHTIILSESNELQLKIGGAYQAVGGMGDTLAGIIAAFIAEFPQPIKATQAAVYIHTAIAEELAGHSYIVKPSFISDFLPNYMSRIKSNL